MRIFQQLTATAVILLVFTASPVRAHPHIFAEARLDVLVGPGGIVQGLRHVWRFDDIFSSTILLEFDTNSDLVLDEEELESVAKVVMESISEFNFFQSIYANGSEVEMAPPKTLVADFQDQQFILLFETRPAKDLRLQGSLSFGVFDPTFYTAIDFFEDSYLATEGLPPECKRDVIRPDPDQAIAQNQTRLTEAFFEDPGGNDLSKLFATRLELTCPNAS